MADNNLPPDPSNYDPSNQAAFNKFAKENAKLAAEITDEARSLTEELKDQLGIRSRLNETERSTLNLARQLQNSAAQNTVEIGNSGNIQRQINKDKRIALNIEREINDLKSTASKGEIEFAEKISATNDEINRIQKELAEATGKRAEELKDQLGTQEDILKFSLEDAKSSTQRLALAMSMSKTTAKLIAQRQAESDIQDDITDRMGVTGALVKGTGALMERLGMRSGIFQKAMTDSAEAMRDMAEQTERGEESFSKTEIMIKGFSVLSKGFGKALFDPFTIATGILDTFFKINKQTVEISRLTGQSATSGMLEFGDGAASAVDRLEVVAELTKEMGINAQNAFSKENLQGAANLKVEMGLAAGEAGNLAIMAQTSNRNVEELTDSIVATTSEFNGANRTAISQGTILRDIGNVSEGIRASFAGNTEALVKGAAAARRLGMDIKDLDSIASSLMDFESSIGNELEAQLLTGKNINMAKARELALSNDLEGLGKELLKNSSDINEFGKMNRIQQEAQAKALGMTRDQLARVAYQRALDLEMTEDAAAAAAGVNAEDMKRITAQENFAKALEKIASALAPILNVIGDIMSMPFVPQLILAAVAVKKIGGGIFGMAEKMGDLVGKTKEFLLQINSKGIKKFFSRITTSFKGGVSGDTTKKLTESVPPKAGETGGKGITGISNAISKIDMKKVLQGAAALAIVAGAVFIFGKAVQQFMEVTWSDVGKAVVGMFALVGAVAALGAFITTPIGAVAILAGAAAMLVMAGAVLVLGYGVQALATGFNMMIPNLVLLAQMVPQLFGVGLALMSIAAGLGMIAVAGLAAIPALSALSMFALAATPLMAIAGMFGGGGEEDGDGFARLEAKLDTLIEVVSTGGNVYLDSDKIGRTQAKSFSKLTA